jgi:methylphosphotriester-DNA--protein-cysteine methyltransferase
MAEHLAEDLNLDQLAVKVGLSKFHFHRLFKRATGLSPSHYQIANSSFAAFSMREGSERNGRKII